MSLCTIAVSTVYEPEYVNQSFQPNISSPQVIPLLPKALLVAPHWHCIHATTAIACVHDGIMHLQYHVTLAYQCMLSQGCFLHSPTLCSSPCRQEYYRETYLRVQPLTAATQPIQTRHILPSFAKPQPLAASDSSVVLLEPEPYLHASHDIVNHTADTQVGNSKASSLQQHSTAKYRGQEVRMPEPTQAPVHRSDLLIAITSAAGRWVPAYILQWHENTNW